MKSKKLTKLAMATVLLFSSLMTFNALADSNNSKCLPANCQMLFIQIAKSGQIIADKTQLNSYKLILNSSEPYISYFTDRPQRATGLLTTKQFYNLWNQQKDIKQSPPNVALETSDVKSGQRINQVLELSNPTYDSKTNQITYTAKTLNHQPILSNPTLGYTVLFIDDFHWGGNEIG